MLSGIKLIKFISDNNLPRFRADQIMRAVYKEGISEYEEMKVLPQNVRDLLNHEVPLLSFEVVKEVSTKSGDTTKSLFKMKGGELIEGVLMQFADGRNSVCVSSQVGCGLRCKFCATGRMGFTRNLGPEEIADQVLYFDQLLKKRDKNARVDHVVYMGMGEPFLNYDSVMESVRILNDLDCLGIASRKITVSTSGIVTSIRRFTDDPLQVSLAVSLHASNQKLRVELMPVADGFSLDDLMAALNDYQEKTRRRISYEYVMLREVNDTEDNARELASLIRGQLCHVNLIPYNDTKLGFENSGRERISAFRGVLESFDIPVTVRVSLGQDISAACGQLAAGDE